MIFRMCFVEKIASPRSCTAAAAGALLLFAVTTSAFADGCVPPASQASKAAIADFLKNPVSLLGNTSSGNGKLAASVRQVVISDTAAISAVVKLAADAKPDQLSAIGAGLGQAALVCRKTNTDLARQIQKAVVSIDKNELLASFESVVQEQLTSATSDPDPSSAASEPVSNYNGEAIAGGGPNPIRDQPGGGGTSFTSTGGLFAPSASVASNRRTFLSTTALSSTSPFR